MENTVTGRFQLYKKLSESKLMHITSCAAESKQDAIDLFLGFYSEFKYNELAFINKYLVTTEVINEAYGI